MLLSEPSLHTFTDTHSNTFNKYHNRRGPTIPCFAGKKTDLSDLLHFKDLSMLESQKGLSMEFSIDLGNSNLFCSQEHPVGHANEISNVDLNLNSFGKKGNLFNTKRRPPLFNSEPTHQSSSCPGTRDPSKHRQQITTPQHTNSCVGRENLPNLNSTSLFSDFQKKNLSLATVNPLSRLDITTSTTAAPSTTGGILSSTGTDCSFSSNRVFPEDEIVPALRKRLDGVTTSLNDDQGLQKSDSRVQSDAAPLEGSIDQRYCVRPQVNFLRKGSRNKRTILPREASRVYQYYSNAVSKTYRARDERYSVERSRIKTEDAKASVPVCYRNNFPKDKKKSTINSKEGIRCVTSADFKAFKRSLSPGGEVRISPHNISKPWSKQNVSGSSKTCVSSVSERPIHDASKCASKNALLSSSVRFGDSNTNQAKGLNVHCPTHMRAKCLSGEYSNNDYNSSSSMGYVNSNSCLKKSNGLMNDDKVDVSRDLEILTVQAQAKMALMDEQIAKLDAFRKELEGREMDLCKKEKQFIEQQERQRLELAVDRETQLLEVERAREVLRREKRKRKGPSIHTETLEQEKDAMENEIRKLRIAFAEQEDEFKKREDRYRKLVDRLNTKVHLLEGKIKAVTEDLEQRLVRSNSQGKPKRITPRPGTLRKSEPTDKLCRKVDTSVPKTCNAKRLTQSTPVVSHKETQGNESCDHTLSISSNPTTSASYHADKVSSCSTASLSPRGASSLHKFQRLIEFDLRTCWSHFDEALTSLRRPEAMTLREPPVSRADGRQEFLYNDGHLEVIFANGMRKTVSSVKRDFTTLLNGWSFTFFNNGDIRGVNPSGVSYYYFHSDTIYSITESDGTVFNCFPDGQIDCRYPSNVVQVRLPQGILKQIDNDGTEHLHQLVADPSVTKAI